MPNRPFASRPTDRRGARRPSRGGARRRASGLAVAALALATGATGAAAQVRAPMAPRFPKVGYMRVIGPHIYPGAVELGLTGSVTSVDGDTRSTAGVRLARFSTVRRGIGGTEIEIAHTHAASFDQVDAQLAFSWQPFPRRGGLLPYAAVAGGAREEWRGGARTTRYPVGVDAGIRLLANQFAGARVEYRFRRVLDDPVADFDEQRIVFGLSLFLHNGPPR